MVRILLKLLVNLSRRVKIKKRRKWKMFDIKKWVDRLDSLMIAITFAEAGQREMAMDFLKKKRKKKRLVSKAEKHAEQRPVLRV
jgi:hypothetical protein